MARAQTAFLARKDVPTRAALQQAIDALKLKLTLDDAYAPFKSLTYLPCTIDGEDAGFDIRFQDVDASFPVSANLQPQLGDKDVGILFRWGGDQREQASVLIVCAALAKNFGALIYDPDADAVSSADDILAKARKAAAF